MRCLAVLALAAAAVPIGLTGCMQRAIPADRSIEVTSPTTSPSRSLPSRLRVVTFNVHREPADVIARGIASDPRLREADLIVLQEVHRIETDASPGDDACSSACTLGKELGYHALYAPGHVQGDGTDGVAILSRAPILASEVIELPYFDVTFNSGRRVALAATILVDRRPVIVYAVHLDNRITAGQRRTQMLPVLRHARQHDHPVIIAGDFNTSPFTWIRGVIPILTTTQDNRLEALVREHGFDTPVVDSGPTSRYLGMRLDAIYTRGFTIHAFDTSHAADVSDHLALWAEGTLSS